MSDEYIGREVGARRRCEFTFFELAERFRAASNPEEIKELGDRLGRLVFGR